MDYQRASQSGKASYFIVIPIRDENLINEFKKVQNEALKLEKNVKRSHFKSTNEFHLTLLGMSGTKCDVEVIKTKLASINWAEYNIPKNLELTGLDAWYAKNGDAYLWAKCKEPSIYVELSKQIYKELKYYFEENQRTNLWLDDPTTGAYEPHVTIIQQPKPSKESKEKPTLQNHGRDINLFKKVKRKWKKFDFQVIPVKIELQHGYEILYEIL